VFKFKKSAGIKVGFRAYRDIQKGNRCRACEDWHGAINHYTRALRLEPKLAHIQIQKGHALKELGRVSEAANAYIAAFADAPTSNDAFVFSNRHLNQADKGFIELFRETLQQKPNDFPDGWKTETLLCGKKSIFDVTDLLSHYGHSRIPSGIQRVVGEVAYAALKEYPSETAICCYCSLYNCFVGLPTDLFMGLFELSNREDLCPKKDWEEKLDVINSYICYAFATKIDQRSCVISLGSNWSVPGYFDAVKFAKNKYKASYVSLLHDIIPILRPDYCDDNLVKDFVLWIKDIRSHSDIILANSTSTRNDFRDYMISTTGEMPTNLGDVLRIDARNNNFLSDEDVYYRNKNLAGGEYILFVSSIEPRKGHLVAIEAWEILYKKYGDTLPKLLCVGNSGWKSKKFFEKLKSNPILEKKVVIAKGVTDTQLKAAYENCLFTIYPSFYEGWGLPITESLAFGKVPISADNSSLPEATGTFGLVFKTGDGNDLAAKIDFLLSHEAERLRFEQDIKRNFRPTSWRAVARQVLDVSKSLRLDTKSAK